MGLLGSWVLKSLVGRLSHDPPLVYVGLLQLLQEVVHQTPELRLVRVVRDGCPLVPARVPVVPDDRVLEQAAHESEELLTADVSHSVGEDLVRVQGVGEEELSSPLGRRLSLEDIEHLGQLGIVDRLAQQFPVKALLGSQIRVSLRLGGLLQMVEPNAERVDGAALYGQGGESSRHQAETRCRGETEFPRAGLPCVHVNPRFKRPSAGRRGARRLKGTGEWWAALAVSQGAERL